MDYCQEKSDLCKEIARKIRVDSIKLTYQMGSIGAHIGGALSLAEILAVLYCGVMNINIHNVLSEQRDRFILSKGHGTLAMYSAMKYAGLISEKELQTYKKNDTFLYAHPSLNRERGIEFSSGSLGQGLSLGVGTCLALKRKGNVVSKVYVVLGDGECDEGSVWEAAQAAHHFKCENLVAIVDVNGLQYDGRKEDVMGNVPFEKKWESFGWTVRCVNGHNVNELFRAFTELHEQPLVVLANTVKGKGVSFMENNPLWHNHSLTDIQYQKALEELHER